MLLPGLILAGLIVALALVVRFGVRGHAPTRVLARGLNLSARRKRLARPFSRLHARLYRRSGGRLLNRWFGQRVLVIETKGRKTGKVRQTAIIYFRDGDAVLVTPANAGSDETPNWWLNLLAAGEGAIVIGKERRRVRPRIAVGAERERLWSLMVREGPAVGVYPDFTDRELPVAVLEPMDP